VGETADQLREEIDAKRDDAAAKIDRIEARVFDTAQLARETVDETVQQARDTVQQARDTVIETVETVKQSFDISHQVQERPWPTLGMAVAGGFILGRIFAGDDEEQRRGDYGRTDRYFTPQSSGTSSAHAPHQGDADHGGMMTGLREAAKSAGLDNMMSALSGALIGVLTDRIRDAVEQNFPEFADQLRRQSERQGSGGSSLWTDTRSTGTGAATSDASGRPTGYATASTGSGFPG